MLVLIINVASAGNLPPSMYLRQTNALAKFDGRDFFSYAMDDTDTLVAETA